MHVYESRSITYGSWTLTTYFHVTSDPRVDSTELISDTFGADFSGGVNDGEVGGGPGGGLGGGPGGSTDAKLDVKFDASRFSDLIEA